MSSKPKAADYKPSEAEKTSAAVAQAEYNRFKQLYDPLLQQVRDRAQNENVKSGLRGRANADVMQEISGPSYLSAQRGDASADMAGAISGQLSEANKAADTYKNELSTGVLEMARNQSATAQEGLANASRLATSNLLERAKAKQTVAEAKAGAAGQIATAAVLNAIRNKAAGGTIFTPPGGGSLKNRYEFATGTGAFANPSSQPAPAQQTPAYVPATPLGFFSPTGPASAFTSGANLAARPKSNTRTSALVTGMFAPRGG